MEQTKFWHSVLELWSPTQTIFNKFLTLIFQYSYSNTNVNVEYCRVLYENISKILLTLIFVYGFQMLRCLHKEHRDVSLSKIQKLLFPDRKDLWAVFLKIYFVGLSAIQKHWAIFVSYGPALLEDCVSSRSSNCPPGTINILVHFFGHFFVVSPTHTVSILWYSQYFKQLTVISISMLT